MQRVISYTRFSPRKQARGLNEIRQMESVAAWCKENGYVLDANDQYAGELVSRSGREACASLRVLSTLRVLRSPSAR